MTYFCWTCHNFMSEEDIDRKWYTEKYEYWGAPHYEEIAEDHCPFCGSENIDEAKCERCGKVEYWDGDFHYEDETLLCEKCWEEDHGRDSED